MRLGRQFTLRARAAVRGYVVAIAVILSFSAGVWTPIPAEASVQLNGFSVTGPPAPEPESTPPSSSTSRLGGAATVSGDLPTHDPTVGTAAGQAGTDGGAATYSISIAVPPGRAGMQPSLSLNYNSRAGNGVMGVGWSIGGLSSIHRCPQTPEQDGVAVGVSYTGTSSVSNDRLCLDGQRLVPVAGNYGAAGTEYRTEVETYARIFQVGGSGLKDNTACFRVEHRDGRILHYGGVVSSATPLTCTITANNSRVIPNGAPSPLSWLVEKIEDRVGNNQLYAYAISNANGNFGPGEVLPSTVTYTGTGSTAGDRVVTFNYQARTSAASGALDTTSSYLAGGLTMTTQALRCITTQIGAVTPPNGPCDTTAFIRTYTPTYMAAAYNARLLVTDLQECATNGGSTFCHQPTHFAFNDATLNKAINFPLTALNLQSFGLPSSTFNASPYTLTTIADLDGDGARESAATVYDTSGIRTFLLQFTGNRSVSNVVEMTGTPFSTIRSNYADLDGDGRAELIETPLSGLPTVQKLSLGVWDAVKFPRGTPATSNPFFTVTSNIPFNYGADGPIYTADMNGDGKLDVIIVKPDAGCSANSKGVYVYLNNNSGAFVSGSTPSFTAPATHLFCLNRVVNGSTYADPIIHHIADFNGDGAPDFYLTYTGTDITRIGGLAGVMLTQNQGTSVTSLTCGQTGFLSTDECAGNLAYYQTWMDINGDGLEDFVIARPGSTNHWQVRLNQGGTLGAAIDTGSSAGLDAYATGTTPTYRFKYLGKLQTMDIDGDGRPEIMVPSHTGGKNGFALKMCTLELVPMIGAPNNRHCADVQTSPTSPAQPSSPATPEGMCSAYACPEDPSGTMSMPANYQPIDKLAYPNWWTDEHGQIQAAFDLYNGDPAHGDVSIEDNSSYYLAALKFVQSDAGTIAVNLVETPLVSRLNAGGGTFSQSDDLFGDSLPDVIAPIGCAAYQKTPTAGGENGVALNTCQVVGDGSYGPDHLFDTPTGIAGTATAGFNTTAALYASVNEGVPGGSTPLAMRNLSTPPALTGRTIANSTPIANLNLPTLPGLVNTSVNGLGDTANWYYVPLSYSGGVGVGFPIYSVSGTYSDSRHYYFQSAMPVVYEMTQSNGTGNGQVLGLRAATYGYAEAMYNHFGRGFQGFHQIITETSDNAQQRVIRTTTVYNQKYPLAGKIDTITTSVPNITGTTNAVVTVEKDNWICTLGTRSACPQDGSASGRYAPVLDTQTVKSYDMGTGAQYAEVDTVNATSAGASGWDANGNLTAQQVTKKDVGSPSFVTSHITTTTNSYNSGVAGSGCADDTASWWLNKLCQSIVQTVANYDATRAFPGDTSNLTQTLTTNYTWNADRTPQTKTVQPTIANQQSTTTYCYPSASASSTLPCPATSGLVGTTSYGLPSSVKVCLGYLDAHGACKGASTDGNGDVLDALSPTRSTSFVYTKDGTTGIGDGYFLLTTTNAKGQVSTTTHETNDGQVLTATDPNGVQVVTAYDVFGRAVQIDHKDKLSNAIEPTTYMAYISCLDSTRNSGNCANTNVGEELYSGNFFIEATAAYSVTTVQSGYPTQVGWYDLLARNVKQGHRGFDGTFIATRSSFDEMGVKMRQSTPYYVCLTCTVPLFQTTWTYDSLNRPTTKVAPGSEIDPAHGDMQTDYIYNGRKTTLVAHGTAGGTVPTGTTCPSGTNMCVLMTRSTNALGQVMQTSEVPFLKNTSGSYVATTLTTNFWTDALGHVAAMRDAEGNNTTSIYNALGQRTASSDPDQGSWTYNYDALGELLSQTDARLVVTTVNARDVLGRTTEQQQVPPASAPGVDTNVLVDDWVYDPTGAIGKLDHITRYRGTTRTTPYNQNNPVVWNEAYTYDTPARLTGISTTVAESGSTVLGSSMDYDGSGRPNSHTYPGGLVVKNNYTTYGQLQSLTNSSTTTYWTATAQNEWDHVTGETFYGNITGAHQDYSSTGQASLLSWTNQDTFTYGYDSFGNLRTQNRTTNAANGESFSYDPLQRLTQSARTSGGAAVNYGYTASGNLAYKDDYSTNTSTSSTPAYTYAGANAITNNCGPHAANTVTLPNSMTATYQCDPNGNVITGTMTFVGGNAFTATFDPGNHPTQVSRTFVGALVEPCRSKTTPADSIFCDGYEVLSHGTSMGTTTWHYDSNGQRDYEFSSAGTRLYGPAGYERLISGGVTKHIAELGPVIVTRIGSADSITVVLRDRLGSTLDTIDGAQLTQRAFDAFGKARNGNMTDRPNGTLNLADTIHGFTTHTHADDVALVHMKGRVFDPNLGRFLNVDPVVQGTHSQALNPYSYLGNNPLSGTDPTGYVEGCTGGAGGACEDPVANGTYAVNQHDSRSADPFSGRVTVSVNDGTVRAYSSEGGAVTLGTIGSNGFVPIGSQGAGGVKNAQASAPDLMASSNAPNTKPGELPASQSQDQGTTALGTIHVTASVADANQRLDDANKNFGEVARGGFKSRHDARLASALAWVPDGLLTNREANWYVLDFSNGTFGYTYPHVGATNEAVVAPVSIDTVKLNQSDGATVTRVDMNHNHLRGDLQFSGHDQALLRDPRYRSLDFWMWNSNGEAYMLRNSDSSGAISRSQQLEGTRMSEFDIH